MSAKVAICVPIKNRAGAIDVTIRQLLELDYDDYKILACDGLSKDYTMTNLLNLQSSSNSKLVAWQTEDEGYVNTHNFILSKIKDADYFCFIDSDDFVQANKLKEQVKFLEENPDIDVVSSTMMTNDKRVLANSYVNLNHEQIDQYLQTGMPMNTVCHFQSCLFRSRVLDKFSSSKYFYNEYESGHCGDGFLYTLYYLGYKFSNINSTVYIYTKGVLKDSMTNNIVPEFANSIDVLTNDERKEQILNLFNTYNPQKKKKGRPKKEKEEKVTE